MSAISDFSVRQNKANERIDAALVDVADDIKRLTDAVSNGTLSAADQAVLDAQAAKSEQIAAVAEALAAQTV